MSTKFSTVAKQLGLHTTTLDMKPGQQPVIRHHVQLTFRPDYLWLTRAMYDATPKGVIEKFAAGVYLLEELDGDVTAIDFAKPPDP